VHAFEWALPDGVSPVCLDEILKLLLEMKTPLAVVSLIFVCWRSTHTASCPIKDPRFVAGEERMRWHGGTHELGSRIGKLLEQIMFWG
jgi:hypothetical protein